MTQNQLMYQSNLERERSARAQELENNRSNVEREFENRRSNVAKESENYRSNTTREGETYRTNFANEKISITRNTNEYSLRNRSNELEKERNTETKRANQRKEFIDWELGLKNLAKQTILGKDGLTSLLPASGGKPSAVVVPPVKTSQNGRFTHIPVASPKAPAPLNVNPTLATITKTVKGISPMFVVQPAWDAFKASVNIPSNQKKIGTYFTYN